MRTLMGKYFDFGKCFMVRVVFDWSLEGNSSVDTASSKSLLEGEGYTRRDDTVHICVNACQYRDGFLL